MAVSFSSENWAEGIARESEKPEYQTAEIQILDPSLVTSSYNEKTGKFSNTGNPVKYEGRARVIPVRWGVFSGGESQANATTLTSVRVQVPSANLGSLRVHKGWKVFVTSAPRSPWMESRLFTVTSDLQGSSSASRTFQCEADGDAKAVKS